MPTNERAIKGEKNKKTTDDKIAVKEKEKGRRESSLPPKQADPNKSDRKSNQDEPKAEKQRLGANDNKDKGIEKPKKKDENKKSKR